MNKILIKYTTDFQVEDVFLAHSHMRKTAMSKSVFFSGEKLLHCNSFMLVFVAVFSLRILTYKAPPAEKGFISAVPMVSTGLHCALCMLRKFEPLSILLLYRTCTKIN